MATKQVKSFQGKGNPFETETVKQVQKQVLEGAGEDFINQLLGANLSTSEKKAVPHAENAPNQDPRLGWVDLFDVLHHKKTHSSEKPAGHEKIQAAMNYSQEITNTERFSKKETKDMDRKVEQIMHELKKLVNSSRMLQMEFETVAVEDKPVKVGEYHLNFYEWMLIVIRNAREKVENSGAWLSTVKGKNCKKGGGYWDMIKQHGKNFNNGERSSATQTG